MQENQSKNITNRENSLMLEFSKNSEKSNTQLNNNKKQGILSFKMKIIIFILIGIITLLMASIIIIIMLYSKSSKNHKTELQILIQKKVY